MVIGVPREIKDNECRVGLVPSGVAQLKDSGHTVLVETNAGAGSSIPDDEYLKAGAEIAQTAQEVYARAGLIVKVKEPRPQEYGYLREDLVIFTFFHLAADPRLADELIMKGTAAIAYETVELPDDRLPILAPMSEVAGRLSVQVGAHYLMKPYGGAGVLLGGVPGVEKGAVAILGAGVVGTNAAKIAVGLGARVLVLDTRAQRFSYLDDIFGARVTTLMSNSYNIERSIEKCDLLIGATHVPGSRTPKIVTRQMLSLMKKGSVIVDVSVDQGGCVETIRPTTHSDPAYLVDGVVHYGVANMPGAVPRTSTFALANATLPYVAKLAALELKEAVSKDPSLGRGVNILGGKVTHPAVAASLGKPHTPLEAAW